METLDAQLVLTLFTASLSTLYSLRPARRHLVYDVDFPANANAGTEGSSRDNAGNIMTINKFGAGYKLSAGNGNSALPIAELRML